MVYISNSITRDGGVALCEALKNHSSLSYLKLSCCALQDEGAFAVSELLKVSSKLREY
jgi:Ran GTPase-activating protein (RanGAP) involved in mRNA processing and transport